MKYNSKTLTNQIYLMILRWTEGDQWMGKLIKGERMNSVDLIIIKIIIKGVPMIKGKVLLGIKMLIILTFHKKIWKMIIFHLEQIKI
jgi:hypothetical protein